MCVSLRMNMAMRRKWTIIILSADWCRQVPGRASSRISITEKNWRQRAGWTGMIMVRGGMIRCWEGGMEWILCAKTIIQRTLMDIVEIIRLTMLIRMVWWKCSIILMVLIRKLHIIIGFIIRLWGGRNILIMVIEKCIFPNLNFGNGRGVEVMRM